MNDDEILLRRKFSGVWPLLDERGRRLMAASEALSLGYGCVLPQIEMLPKNVACFCSKSDVDRDENLSTVRTSLQDTCAGW
jgi:hypothetical protein